MDSSLYNDLFPSLISDIKNYSGRDPLLPWLRGIKKMKASLPPQILREKLPRFLQKCAQTFESDQRYKNDLRYLRVWLQLLDFVDDPKAVLQTMEASRIGMKKSLFYQAYALYYEKMKKFESADRMYRLGAQNLAEPMAELSKSYEQFVQRMMHHKNKKIQRNGRTVKKMPQNVVKVPVKFDNSSRTNDKCMSGKQDKGIHLDASAAEMQHNSLKNQSKDFSQSLEHQIPRMNNGEVCRDSSVEKGLITGLGCKNYSKEIELERNEYRKISGEDTMVARFVDTAIIGKSNAEDARHHGLVEPTINTKEAMLAINSMFREPLEPPLTGRRRKNHPKADQSSNCGFEVFIDDNPDENIGTTGQDVATHSAAMPSNGHETNQQSQQHFQIYIDAEETNDETEVIDGEDGSVHTEGLEYLNFLSPSSEDLPSEASQEHSTKPPDARFREDTVIYRFVGSTTTDGPQVENACHHGLVEPTVNLKEAMDDINSMFGKPIEFARKSRSKKQEKVLSGKSNAGGFMILPDDTIDCQQGNSKKQEKGPGGKSNAGGFMILPDDTIDCKQGNSKPSSSNNKGRDLFEQTICTKEAMDEINNLFKMPLDF
ncbi:hypothetical protein Leryth_007950 [Lithospermum erythrorhizon]|nr:hypothetical protein Leryth_007950 [Lithospermum erythrorhizon]